MSRQHRTPWRPRRRGPGSFRSAFVRSLLGSFALAVFVLGLGVAEEHAYWAEPAERGVVVARQPDAGRLRGYGRGSCDLDAFSVRVSEHRPGMPDVVTAVQCAADYDVEQPVSLRRAADDHARAYLDVSAPGEYLIVGALVLAVGTALGVTYHFLRDVLARGRPRRR